MILEYQSTLKQQVNLLKYHSTASYLVCPSEAEMVDLKMDSSKKIKMQSDTQSNG